jgi:hypothetical protein
MADRIASDLARPRPIPVALTTPSPVADHDHAGVYDPAGTAAAAVAAHAAAADPHTGYQKESEKGAANGYASLDGSTLVPFAQLGTGTASGTKFLRDDRSWQEVGGGGGTATTFGTATIDFGSFPGSNEASVAVTGQTEILGTSKVEVFLMASDTTADHTENDHRYAALFLGLSAGTIDVGVGFTIYARSLEKLTGTFSVRWRWT